MGFDLERFRSAALVPCQERVPVPDLKSWFGEGDDPIWIVRGLTGEEFMRAQEAANRYDLVLSAARALASAGSLASDREEHLKRLIGFGSQVPAEMAKGLDALVFGSVDPVIDRDGAVRLYAAFPIVAWHLVQKILALTGMGAEPGKSSISTEPPT